MDTSLIEECWRQGKYDLLVSKYYPEFANFGHTIANYYRTDGSNYTRHSQISIEECELAN